MPNFPSFTLIRGSYNDLRAEAPNFTDNDVAWEHLYNERTGSYILNIVSFDGSIPTAAGNVTEANSTRVPIGSLWYCAGNTATNVMYKKTAAAVWTEISGV